MTKSDLFPAWGRILRGYRPLLSVEITKECPLRCPGCYAYEPEHLGNGVTLRQLADFKGQDLVEGMLALVRRYRPIHLSIVGGEPLVRKRELDALLPKLRNMGIEVQLVTSAVTEIPRDWARFENLHLVVSIDGLAPEHDHRRAPATYARILKNIAGHEVLVHCTITSQLLSRSDYLEEFTAFWSGRSEVRRIWFSLFTPQEGQDCEERLTAGLRAQAVRTLRRLRGAYPKIHLPGMVLDGYLDPPRSPEECVFAQMTTCVSADLKTQIGPCQFGGQPMCTECGCMASAGLASLGNFRLGGIVKIADILGVSRKIGRVVRGAAA
jgi:organic radical activating enzyme